MALGRGGTLLILLGGLSGSCKGSSNVGELQAAGWGSVQQAFAWTMQ